MKDCESCKYCISINDDRDLWCYLGHPTHEGICNNYVDYITGEKGKEEIKHG